MFGLKSAYFYLVALQVTFVKFFKKLYFSTSYYNNSLNSKIPLLGICVGMQILANKSEEGKIPGLGWISGDVCAFSKNPIASKLPLPHMGWNTLNVSQFNLISSGNIDQLPEYYFLHSYYFDTKDKSIVSATSNYGFNFDAVVSRGNIHGVQCHPEKSHHWGEQLIKNFSGKD